MKKPAFIAAPILLFVSVAGAQTYLGIRELGDPVASWGARGLALGGTGVAGAQGPEAPFWNPALNGGLAGPGVSLSLGAHFLSELAVESNTQSRFRSTDHAAVDGFAFLYPVREGKLWLWTGAAPRFDMAYDGHLSEFNANGTLDRLSRLRDDGFLGTASIASGWAVTPRFSVGVAWDFWLGRERLNAFILNVSSNTTLDWTEEARYGGGAPRAGLAWRWTDSATLGLSAEPPFVLRRRYDFAKSTAPASALSGDDRWRMPWRVGVGVTQRLEGARPTTWAFDYRWTGWEKLRVNGSGPNVELANKPLFEEMAGASDQFFSGAGPATRLVRDTHEFAFGVEHSLKPGWALRFGFRYLPSFADDSVDAVFVALGLGRAVNHRWGWSLGGEYGKRDYKGDNVTFPAARRIEETLRRFVLSAHYLW